MLFKIMYNSAEPKLKYTKIVIEYQANITYTVCPDWKSIINISKVLWRNLLK